MLWTIAVILLVLWALGLVTSTSMGGLIHILLVVAVIMVLINLFSRTTGGVGGNQGCSEDCPIH